MNTISLLLRKNTIYRKGAKKGMSLKGNYMHPSN